MPTESANTIISSAASYNSWCGRPNGAERMSKLNDVLNMAAFRLGF